MGRRYHEPDGGFGAGEFFAFLVVVAVSAGAFLYIGSSRPPSVARVVSMHDAAALGESTASAIVTTIEPGAAPLPKPRPR